MLDFEILYSEKSKTENYFCDFQGFLIVCGVWNLYKMCFIFKNLQLGLTTFSSLVVEFCKLANLGLILASFSCKTLNAQGTAAKAWLIL